MVGKKAQLVVGIDIVLAMIVLLSLFLLHGAGAEAPDTTQLDYLAHSADIFADVTVGSLSSEARDGLHNVSSLTDDSFSLARQIFLYFFCDNRTLAADLAGALMEEMVDDRFGYSMGFSDEFGRYLELASNDLEKHNVRVYRRFVPDLSIYNPMQRPRIEAFHPFFVEVRVWD